MLIKMDTADLRIGMFVTDLDRPWLDTPFLMQGLQIETDGELATLREHCDYVYVDPDRSGSAVLGIHKNLLRESTKEDSTPFNWGVSPETRGSRGPVLDLTGVPRNASMTDTAQFNQRIQGTSPIKLETTIARSRESQKTATIQTAGFFQRMLEPLLGLFETSESANRSKRREYIPQSIKLVEHVTTHSLEQEYPHVSQIFASAKYAMNKLVADVLAKRSFALDDIHGVVRDIVTSMLRNPNALMWIAMIKQQDAELYGHGIRVAVYMVALGRKLGLPKKELIQLATIGLLLDIGKTTLPMRLLTKPGRLSETEFALAKTHVNIGLKLIETQLNHEPDVLRGIAEHHERENGSGYPNGLMAGNISLFGRIAAIVDCFVALTHDRSYAPALAPYNAMRQISEWSNSLFYAPLAEALIQTVGVFPVGSLIELSSQEVGVVVAQNKSQRLKPRILKIAGTNKQILDSPEYIDLANEVKQSDDAQPLHIVRGLRAGTYNLETFDPFIVR